MVSSKETDMARATRDNGIVPPADLQPGMKVFRVVNNTIIDSLGAYCKAGQEAALTKADATRYHKLNMIQVALPDFDEPPVKEKAKDVGKPSTGASAEAAADAGEIVGEGATKPAADGGGREPTRRV